MTRTGRLASTLVFVTLLMGGCAEPPPPVVPGETAPSFMLPSLAGGEVSSDDLDARPTVLAFWATWCRPCLKEIPILNELTDDPRVQVVSIALDVAGEKTVRPFVEEHGLRYPVLLGNEDVFRSFDGVGIPHTLVLDGARRIVAVHRGTVEREDLAADLARAASGNISP